MNLVAHFYATRQVSIPFKEAAWEDYFIKLTMDFYEDRELLEEEVSEYWDNVFDANSIYQTEFPPHLSKYPDWGSVSFWKNLTPGALAYTIKHISDYNELRLTSGLSEQTILCMAVSNGANLSTIESLVEAGADINFPQISLQENFSLLSVALFASSTEVVKFLIERGANIEDTNENYKFHELNILQYAALAAKHPDSFEYLLNATQNDSLFVDSQGYTLLHYLAEAGYDRTEFIERYLDFGGDLEARSSLIEPKSKIKAHALGNETPLLSSMAKSLEIHLSSESLPNINNLKCILKHGANVDAKDTAGNNAAH